MLVGSLGSLHSSCGWEACSWVTKKQWWICNLNPQRARQAASKIATASPRHSMPENREKTRQFTVPQFERSIIALRKLVAETQETQSNSVQIPFHGPWWFFLTFKILIKNRSLRFTAFSPQNSQHRSSKICGHLFISSMLEGIGYSLDLRFMTDHVLTLMWR